MKTKASLKNVKDNFRPSAFYEKDTLYESVREYVRIMTGRRIDIINDQISNDIGIVASDSTGDDTKDYEKAIKKAYPLIMESKKK